MLLSIPDIGWRVDAEDPTALTRILDLPGLFVTGLEYNDTNQTLHVFCQHTEPTASCPTCRQSSPFVHQYSRRAVRDLPWAGKPCLIEFAARRFYCLHCRCPFREELEWLPRCSRLTGRYRMFVFAQCRKTTIQAVSRQERLGYKTLERLYYALATEQTQTLPAKNIRLSLIHI